LSHNYDATGVYCGWSKKLAAWRNGDAKLTSANLVASDPRIQESLEEPVGKAEQYLKTGNNIAHYQTKYYSIGSFEEMYHFQTGRLLYPAFGACSTVENNPSAGYHTHTLTTRTSQTPVNFGRHLERENETAAESDRVDILGLLLETYHLECTETFPKATQSLKWKTAFTKNSATDDIAEPTPLTTENFDWTHLTFPTFTYNSETVEATIVGFAFDVQNSVGWRGLDTTGYYSVGKMFEFVTITVTLMIIPYGKNAFELIRTNFESYVTDLDLTWKFTRNATTDYVQVAHDKMYCPPFHIVPGHRFGWHEGYLMQMHQTGSGSMSGTIIDNLDNDSYENP